MKKRIISLILAAIMLFAAVLTGCAKEEQNVQQQTTQEASESAKTVSMYVVTENEISDATAAKVSDAFNQITKAKFKTRVSMHFVTYDKYYSTIEGVIADNAAREALKEEHQKALKKARQEAKAQQIATDSAWFDEFYRLHPEYAEFRETEALTGDDTTAEETETVAVSGTENFFITQVKYPDEKVGQLDIIWIDSYDRYVEYIEKDYLSRLDEELSAGSKKLKEYISPALLSWAKWAGNGTYAIPNNCVVGEYTYLLLDKKLIDKYNYDPSLIYSISSDETAKYLSDVAKYETGITPINGTIPVINTVYWNFNEATRGIDYDDFCMIGEYYNSTRTVDPSISDNNPIAVRNLFTVSSYTEQLLTIQKFKDLGYINENAGENDRCALKVVKGGKELETEYAEDYYVNVLEYPRISEADVFSSMFAVSSFTISVSRSMQVVTYLNTNSDLRNILQYGVKGVHYELDNNGAVHRLNKDYMMNIRNTGNVFVAYPEENMPLDIWEYGKKQNLDIKAEILNCFRVPKAVLPEREGDDEYGTAETLLNLNTLNAIYNESKNIKAKIDAAKSYDELKAVIDAAAKAQDKAIKDMAKSTEESGLYYVYNTWMQDTKLFIPRDN
ncbi:MAG: hypothetical protein MJ137_09095 [Clostridia bacterium]|nr:hypothetical protein [Clostridia bacterium]